MLSSRYGYLRTSRACDADREFIDLKPQLYCVSIIYCSELDLDLNVTKTEKSIHAVSFNSSSYK
jgi:hypothetical protein